MSNRKRSGGGRRPKDAPEFQRDAVAMVLVEERSIADVARSLGVNEGALGAVSVHVPIGFQTFRPLYLGDAECRESVDWCQG